MASQRPWGLGELTIIGLGILAFRCFVWEKTEGRKEFSNRRLQRSQRIDTNDFPFRSSFALA
jgi:hypothetical protein